MAVELIEREEGRILEVHASGKLAHSDYERFMPRFEQLISQHGRIRILFEMENFRGWKPAVFWDDIKLDWKHSHAMERLAIVGSKKWQMWISGVCRPFTLAEIRYFDRADIEIARKWIAEKSGPPDFSDAPVLRVFQSRAQTKAYYNKISQFYDLLSERSEAPMRKAGLYQLKAAEGEKILEIGFGTGHTLVALAEAVGSRGKVFGVDLSDRMVNLARENLKKAGLLEQVLLRCGDAAQLPYAENSMDGVFMSFTLELFDTPDILQVLGECKRVLRPGGRIVVVGMSKNGGRDPLVSVYEWTHKHFPKFVDCRPIYVQRAVADAGFKIEKVQRKLMWVPVEIVLGLK
jgi:ubiquinone/menaquinone biosynthesis C-methylase UbiE